MDPLRLKNYLPKDLIVATIPINTALSDVIPLGDYTICAIEMPAAWTAAALSFKGASPRADEITQPATLFDINSLTGEFTVPTGQAQASKLVILDPDTFSGIQFLQIRSGVTATPVNQTAERKLRLYVRPILK